MYKTISQMIHAGFCVDRQGHQRPIPSDARMGIPDDDIVLSVPEINLLLGAVEKENRRDHVLIGLLFRTGARISSVLGVRVEDVDFVRGRVFIRSAKEGLSFYRFLDTGFLAELAEYVRFHDLRKPDYLFGVHYRGRFTAWSIESFPISRKTAETLVDDYAQKAGIQYKYVDIATGELRNRVHCHTSKYTFCSMAYDIRPSMLLVALTVGNKTTYPLEKNYIKVPTWERHDLAKHVLAQLTTRHKNQVAHYEHEVYT
jgi:integrase